MMVARAAGPSPDRPPTADAYAVQVTVAGRLDRLVHEIGGDEPVARAVRVFVGRLDSMIEAIVASDDPGRRQELAHTLAGSSETLGAAALGAVAREIMEAPGLSGEHEFSEALHDRLRGVGRAAHAAMLAECDRRGWATAEPE